MRGPVEKNTTRRRLKEPGGRQRKKEKRVAKKGNKTTEGLQKNVESQKKFMQARSFKKKCHHQLKKNRHKRDETTR